MIVKLATLIIKTIDCLTFFLKEKDNKVTYITYRSKKISYGMKTISKELNKVNSNLDEAFLALKFDNTLVSKINYAFNMLKQIYHIKTSSVVVIDGNNFVVSNIKKKDTKIIQMWHSSGAIKKFGMDYKRKYPINNYDYIITTSEKVKPFMSSAFNVDKEQVKVLGYADNDILFDYNVIEKFKQEFYNKYPNLQNKKIVLYAPTFRGEAVFDKQHLDIDLKNIAKNLKKDHVLIYKMHPILDSVDLGTADNLYNLSDINIYKLFTIADILISDYSSIVFDFALIEKPVILHAPDLKQYKETRGMYVDYEQFSPYKITKTEDELIKAINTIDNLSKKDMLSFKNQYFEHTDGKSSSRVADFINDLLVHKTKGNS